MTKETELRPNDVAIILRPTIQDGMWAGDFEVLVSGFGPVTLKKEHMDDMIGMGVLIASVVPFMEEHEDIAKQIMEHCDKYYSHVAEVEYDPNHNSFSDTFVLTADTVTQGGKQ
jgi:hypothetical protein